MARITKQVNLLATTRRHEKKESKQKVRDREGTEGSLGGTGRRLKKLERGEFFSFSDEHLISLETCPYKKKKSQPRGSLDAFEKI